VVKGLGFRAGILERWEEEHMRMTRTQKECEESVEKVWGKCVSLTSHPHLELRKVFLGEHVECLLRRLQSRQGLVQLTLHLCCNCVGLLCLFADLCGLSVHLKMELGFRAQGLGLGLGFRL
jgi:hypothetical protein